MKLKRQAITLQGPYGAWGGIENNGNSQLPISSHRNLEVK